MVEVDAVEVEDVAAVADAGVEANSNLNPLLPTKKPKQRSAKRTALTWPRRRTRRLSPWTRPNIVPTVRKNPDYLRGSGPMTTRTPVSTE